MTYVWTLYRSGEAVGAFIGTEAYAALVVVDGYYAICQGIAS